MALVGERRDEYRVLVGKLDRDCLEDLGIDRRVIMKLISNK